MAPHKKERRGVHQLRKDRALRSAPPPSNRRHRGKLSAYKSGQSTQNYGNHGDNQIRDMLIYFESDLSVDFVIEILMACFRLSVLLARVVRC